MTLTAKRYAYTFTTNGNLVLEQDGTVIEPVSAAGGIYVYDLYNGTYDYTASGTNYITQSGSVTVSYAGGSQEVALVSAQTYPVSFAVTADGERLCRLDGDDYRRAGR